MNLTLQVAENTASELLEGMRARAADAKPAMEQVADELLAGEARWWASAGNGSWPAHRRATERLRAASGLGDELMVASGALRASLTRRGTYGQVLEVTSTSVHLGTQVRSERRGARLPSGEYAYVVGARRPIIAPPNLATIALVVLRYLIQGSAA